MNNFDKIFLVPIDHIQKATRNAMTKLILFYRMSMSDLLWLATLISLIYISLTWV